jgi:hypothetical protein
LNIAKVPKDIVSATDRRWGYIYSKKPEENKNYNNILYFYIEHPTDITARSGLDMVAGA